MTVISFLFGMMLMQEAKAEPTQTTDHLGDVRVSEPFPTFGGYDINNQYVSYKSLVGNYDVIVVSYFATWCDPCKEGLPILEKYAQKHSNVTAVYIALGESDTEKVQQFANQLELKSTIVLDKFQSIGKRHYVVSETEATTLPKTFIVDKDGKVHTIFILEGEDFDQAVQKSLTSLGVQ
jgi:peroxiredoxin